MILNLNQEGDAGELGQTFCLAFFMECLDWISGWFGRVMGGCFMILLMVI